MDRYFSKLVIAAVLCLALISFGCATKTAGLPDDGSADSQVAQTDSQVEDSEKTEAQKEKELEEQRIEAERLAKQKKMEEAKKEKERVRKQALANFENVNIYFNFDSAELSDSARTVLKDKASWLMNNADAVITIEGHCDERGTTEYNLALGERRASSVKAYLKALGVDENRMKTISYGEEKPAVKGANENAWSKNRRAEFVINSGVEY